MAKLPCFDELRKVISDDVPDSVLRSFIKDVGRIQEAKQNSGDFSLINFRQASREFLEGQQSELASLRKERALNIIKRKERVDFINQFSDENKSEALLSIASGGVSLKKGINDSVDLNAQTKSNSYNIALFNGLESKGLLELALEGKIEKEIFKEKWELSSKTGKPGISKNSTALEIAKVFHNVQSLILEDLRRAGGNVKEVQHYIMKQAHNRDKIRTMGETDWINFILPKLNQAKTFGAKAGNHNEMVKFLREAYNDIVFGRVDISDGSEVSGAEFGPTFKAKLGRKISKHRKLFFESSDSFYEYNLKAGNDNIMDSIQKSIHYNARASSVMERFGTDPHKMMEDLKKRIRKDLQGNDKALAKLNRDEKQIDNLFKDVLGEGSHHGESMLAKTGRNLRAATNMALLGKSAFRSVTDMGTAAAALRSATGKGYLEAHSTMVKTWAESVKLRVKDKAEYQRQMRNMGLMFNDYIAEAWARFGADTEGPAGSIAKAQRLYFKVNGLSFQTEMSKFTVAKVFSREIADLSGKKFGELPIHVRENMLRYNFTDEMWAVIKNSVEDLPDGTRAISLEKMRELKAVDPELVRKSELAWMNYITDHTEFGVPTPNARVRNRITRGTSEDDIVGQGLRFFGQFKTFPLAMYDVLGRVALSNPEKPAGDAATLAQVFKNAVTGKQRGSMSQVAALMGTMTALAYVGESFIQIGKGREPPDPLSADTWMDAFVKGGSAGLYADFILGEYDRGYRNFTSQLAGPTAGLADEVASIYTKARKGESIDNDAFRLLSRRAPFVNIFGVEQGLKYLFLDSIQETLSPGYKLRREIRLRREGSEPLFE